MGFKFIIFRRFICWNFNFSELRYFARLLKYVFSNLKIKSNLKITIDLYLNRKLRFQIDRSDDDNNGCSHVSFLSNEYIYISLSFIRENSKSVIYNEDQ